MSNKLNELLINKQENRSVQLIMNAEDYAQRVLLQNKPIPWHDATAYANYFGQGVALLKPQATVIPLDKMIMQELAENKKLIVVMGEKQRLGYALKTFMGNEEFKAATGALVLSTVKTQHIPVLLQLPSPLQMMYLTTQAVRPNDEFEFDDNDAENAAMYFADWLRIFKDAPIAGLIFDERKGRIDQEAYRPIINTAEHYGWSVGMRQDDCVIEFCNPKSSILILDTNYWLSGEADVEIQGTLFTEIARDAVPEQVLELREKLN